MKITVRYDLDKEYENLLVGRRSINHGGQDSRVTKDIIDSGINPDDKQSVCNRIDQITKERNIDVNISVADCQDVLNDITDGVVEKLDSIFQIRCPFNKVDIYLTINDRCSYNFRGLYFFATIADKGHFSRVVIHELLHFYTHYCFEKEFRKYDLPVQDFNDFKEALTFLLNTEFSNYIGSVIDQGYSKQEVLRRTVEALWQEKHDIYYIAGKVLENYKQNR